MIKLYKFTPCFNLPDPSPFCIKVETFLRMAELDYKPVAINDPRKGPKGKLPFIQDGETMVADSSAIIDYLLRKYRPDMDRELSSQQAALGYHISRMLEEHYYWVIAYSCWIDARLWPSVRAQFFAPFPAPLRVLIGTVMRQKVRRNLYGQGLGRHTQEEIFAMGRSDLQALSASLGDNDFILGLRPSRFDCSVHAFVMHTLNNSLDLEMKNYASGLENLVAYNDRMRQRYYAETI